MFFVWHVPLKSCSTFSAVLWNLDVNLPLKQTFVSLIPAMTPFLSFYYCTLCILPKCAFWAIDVPKMRGFGDNSPMGWAYGWDPHPWPKPRRLMYNMWDSSAQGRLWSVGLPNKSPEKNFANRKLHLYGEPRPPPPADHYELWPTWCSRRRYQLCKFLLWSVEGFLFCEVLKWPFSILSDHCPEHM
jgi:hypothetical protein